MSQYCSTCGEQLASDGGFCPGCGTEVRHHEQSGDSPSPRTETGPVEDSDNSLSRRYLPNTWSIGVASVVFGLVIGGLVAWALTNIGGSDTGFLVAFAGATLYLWQKPTATGVVGSGLYIAALVVILVPLLFYTPGVVGGGDAQTAEAAGETIGSVLGLVIWGFVFALVAVVVGAVGYFFKRREKNTLQG